MRAFKVRSVPKQESYRPLVEVVKEQPVFTFAGIEGTSAGFFTPPFMASLSVPGRHRHFLSADLRRGGHLLECRPRQIRVGVQFIPDSAVDCETKSEAQAFRSEVNGSLPPRGVASTGAMSAALSHLETECRAPKTTLKPYASMPSLLHAHAHVGQKLNCGIRVYQ
jgi:alpha-acetolactate decarboxylase